jgi:hypothetical protein
MKNQLHRESPEGRWSVTVPVLDGERGREVSRGAWEGSEFQPERLHVTPPWVRDDDGARYTLRGPNVRGDGTLGNRDLERRVSRERAEKSYPAAMAEARAALEELAGMIRADAERADAEIRQAINDPTNLEAGR